jgi:nucleoside-diphosphate-sugar epimerase
MILGSVLAARAIPYCFLRPTNIYGPGDTHNNYGPNRFVRTAVNDGKIVLFGRGEERRSQLYVDDAIALVRLAIVHRSEGTLNLAVQPAVSFMDVATVVARGCGNPVTVEFVPRTIAPVHRPYKPTQVFRYIYNLGRKIGPIVHRPYSIAAVRQAFPDFAYTPLEKGIGAYLDFVATHRATAPVSP